MKLTREEILTVDCDVVKQKYFNANKVRAHLETIAGEAERLLAENERLSEENELLRRGAGSRDGREDSIGDALIAAQKAADSLVAAAKIEAAQILTGARENAEGLIADAEARRAQMGVNLSERQLDRIEKLNTQIDELNVSHATQVYKLKQALAKIAADL